MFNVSKPREWCEIRQAVCQALKNGVLQLEASGIVKRAAGYCIFGQSKGPSKLKE
jgi:hypothetical protein